MIVLIGVAFMMGLLSTRAIMETNVDEYDDRYALQDIQIYSSYGFDEEDVKALSEQEFVDSYFASKMVDVYAESNDGFITIARLEEVERDINKFELIEGEMPDALNEVLVLEGGVSREHYNIGDVIKVYLDDEDLKERFGRTYLRVTGIVKTPSYMAKTLGTSLLNNLDLGLIIYAPGENFVSEYYTTLYATTSGARDYASFGAEYEEYMDEISGDIDYFAKSQQDNLKESLLEEYRNEIAEGEEELEKQRTEGQQKLDEAKEKLDDANVQIVAAETQVETLKSALSEAVSRQAALERQYGVKPRESMKEIEQIEKSDPEKRNFDEIYSELSTDYGTYTALKRMSETDTAEVQSAGDAAIEQARTQLAGADGRIAALESERAELEKELLDPATETGRRTEIAARLGAIEVSIAEIEIEKEAYQSIISSYEELQEQDSTKTTQERMDELDNKYGGSIVDKYNEYNRLQQDRVVYETLRQEIDLADQAIAMLQGEIYSAESQIESGRVEYEEGKEEYRKGLIEFNLEIEKAEAEIKKAYQELEELPDAEWTILNRDNHYSTYMFKSNAKQMGAIGISLPILFYLVAALVCMTTMTRLVDEQRGQIGVFRALGFTKNQVIGKYILYALLATTIGSVLGMIFGMAIFPTVIYNTWRLMYDLPAMKLVIPIVNVFICFAAFSVLMSVVTYFVVKKSLDEAPSQLMRPKAPKNAKKIFLEYFTALWNRLSFTSKITARNLIRYKSRFIMTVIGVAGCTGLLVVGWGIKDSISGIVSIQYGDIFNFDNSVYVEESADIEKFVEVLNGNLDNEYVAPALQYASKVYIGNDDPTINVVVLDARDAGDVLRLRKTDKETEIKLKNNGVIVSEKFATNNGIKRGDYITIESEEGIKAEVKVTEICEMYFQHYVFISDDYYYTVFGEHPHHKIIYVKNEVGEDFVKDIEDLDGYESVVDFSSMIEQFNKMIEALDFIILVIILTAGSLAFVVLMNLTQVNISERIREIATLKVLGFRGGEVGSYISKEIFLLSLIGGVIGLPLGVLEHHFIMTVINMDMIMFANQIKLPTFLYAFGLTIIFTLIVLIMTRRPLKKIEMIESLKSVE